MAGGAGRQPHRRSRSIETLGWGGDAREAYRLELERIGSMDKGSEASRCATSSSTAIVTDRRYGLWSQKDHW